MFQPIRPATGAMTAPAGEKEDVMGTVILLVDATIDGYLAGPDRELDLMLPDPVMNQELTTHSVARWPPSSSAATPTTPWTEDMAATVRRGRLAHCQP